MTTAPLRNSTQLLQTLTSRGLSAFQAELEKKPTLPVLRRLHELLEEGVAEKDGLLFGRHDCLRLLEQHMVARGFSVHPRNGRTPPAEGQRRSYRAQQLEDTVFLRLPLASLGAVKGDLIEVAFDAGVISVTRAGKP